MVCVWDAGDYKAWLSDAPAVGGEHLRRCPAEGGDLAQLGMGLVLAGVEDQPAGGGDHAHLWRGLVSAGG